MARIRAFEARECKRIRELLDHFLVGELSVETNQEILSHLEQCAACRQEERSRTEARWFLGQAWQAQPVPAELEKKVTAGLGSRHRLSSHSLRRVAGLTLAALGIAGWMWFFSPFGDADLLLAVDHYQEVAADHVHCTGNPVPPSFQLPLAGIRADLVELLSKQPHRFRLLDIRLCQKGEANLIHYVFQGSSGRLSLVLEERGQGEYLLLIGDEPLRRLHHRDVNLVREGANTLAAFAMGRFFFYLVVQEEDQEAVLDLVGQIIPLLESGSLVSARKRENLHPVLFQVCKDEAISMEDLAHRHFNSPLKHWAVENERMELSVLSAGIHAIR